MSDPNTNTTQTAAKKSSSDTVTICCKLPHGIVLRAFTMVEKPELVMGGGSRMVEKAEQIPGEFTVLGNSYPQGGAPRGRMEFGFAMTTGCPKDLWERWLKDNKGNPMVVNGLIFAHDTERSAIAEAREKENERSGFERLDPNKLPKGLEKAKGIAA